MCGCGRSSGAELNTLEKVCLQTAELISCEWCSVRKLPVLFFQTTEEECVRLRSQLHMSREDGGQWYDCAGDRKWVGGQDAPPQLLGGGERFCCCLQSRTRSTSF